MKALKLFTLLGLASLFGVSCTSGLKLASKSAGDDIYYNPSDAQKGQMAAASNGKKVPLDPTYKNLLDETNRAMADSNYVEPDSTGNPYQDVLADSYEKARRNRELGMRDPSNGFPSYTTRYTDSYWYATAYDPAFYNIIVMGNTIWAEPKYVSAMFGYPYYSPYINFGSYYSPWRNSWNMSFGWSWYDPYWSYGYGYGYGYGWGSPYYGWGGGYYGWGHPYYGGGYYDYPSHGGYWGRNVTYGPRNSSRGSYDGGSSIPTRTYSRSTGMRSVDYGARSAASYGSSYSRSSSRPSSSSYDTRTMSSDANYSRRSSAVRQSRPVQSTTPSDTYVPTYSRPTRTSQSSFNDGARNDASYYSRRSSSVATPRSSYEPSNSNNSSSYSRSSGSNTRSSYNSTYTPTRSSSEYNSGSSSGSTRSSGSSSSSSSGGGYSRRR